MDVLQPQLYWVGNRCYRKNELDSSYSSYQKQTLNTEWTQSYQSYEADNDDNETCEIEAPVEQLSNGKFRTTFSAPSALFPYIIGAKGSTKKKIENETKTVISIPKPGQHGDIVITGSSRSSVITARARIEILSLSARKKQQFTHFVSIPVNSPQIREKFAEFKEKVLQVCSDEKIVDADLFQKSEKLHVTVAVLVLLDESERRKAAELLEDCQETIRDILEQKSIEIHLEGLEYMNDDPSEVDVLYGKVSAPSSPESLQEIADLIVYRFVEAGLMERQYDSVKLHVTLMNSLFKVDADEKVRPKFSAKKILEKFRDFSFGKCPVDSIHLSQRFSTDSDGYYVATSKINIRN